MNFTNSPFERMMKEIPRPGHGGSDPCAGCRHLKECKGQNGRSLWSPALRAKLARGSNEPGADP